MGKFKLLTKKIEKIALAASWQLNQLYYALILSFLGLFIILYLYLPPVVGRRESQA
jgi:hypothetical protein